VPRLAIVISATSSIESLEGTLVSVLENRPADCEVFVALDRPYADPYDLRGEVHFVTAGKRLPLIGAVNQALATTRAHFVHLLSSGCCVSEGWTEPALARFGNRRVAAVAPVVFDVEEPTRILAAGLGYRPSGCRVLIAQGQTEPPAAPPELIGACGFAAFYRRTALELVGRLSPQLGLAQADVDVALSLATAGMTAVIEPDSRVLANREVEAVEEAPFRQSLHEERLFWRNLPSSNRGFAIAAHLGRATWDVARCFPRPSLVQRLAGRALACCQLGSYVRRSAALDALRQHGAAPSESRPGTRVDHSHQQPSRSQSSQAGTAAR
jgi:GT2 family glycosyltransferase